MFLKRTIFALPLITFLLPCSILSTDQVKTTPQTPVTKFQRIKACLKFVFWGSLAFFNTTHLTQEIIKTKKETDSLGILEALNTEQRIPVDLYDQKVTGGISAYESEKLRSIRTITDHRKEKIKEKQLNAIYHLFLTIVYSYTLHCCIYNI